MTFVSELQPSALWSHFDTILTIPRGSKHEEAVTQEEREILADDGADHPRSHPSSLLPANSTKTSSRVASSVWIVTMSRRATA